MSNFRLLPTLLVAAALPLLGLAQESDMFSPPPPPPEPPTEAELALDEAMEKLKGLERVRAKVRQEVDMLGQVFTVDGDFAQSGPYTFSLDLQVNGLPQAKGRMRQVSDGTVLWDVSQILDQTYYYRLDLPGLLDRIDGEPFEEIHKNYFIQQRLALSGPFWLIDGFRQSAKFDRKTEAEYNGRPVWVIKGNWKDMNVLGLPPMASAPAYIPSVIELKIDQETGWPHQVIMLGKKRSIVLGASTPKIDEKTGRPIGSVVTQEEPISKFTLTYSEIEFEPDFSVGEFTFRVPDLDRDRVRNRTPELLAELDQMARLIEADRLQNGRATQDPGAILNDVLQIPSFGGDSPAPAPPAGLGQPSTPPPGN